MADEKAGGFCSGCGSALDDGDAFCFHCGRAATQHDPPDLFQVDRGAGVHGRTSDTEGRSSTLSASSASLATLRPAEAKGRRQLIVGLVVGAAVVLVGLGALLFVRHGSSTPKSSKSLTSHTSTSHTLVGTFEVDFPTVSAQGSTGAACTVPIDYGSEGNGDQVQVSDGSGQTLGIGTLQDGRVVAENGCGFKFTVSGVPNTSFYGITIDGHHSPQYSESQLQGMGWHVGLTLQS
jgi:hypothetical protein